MTKVRVASFAVSLDLRSLGYACTTFTASEMALHVVLRRQEP